MNVISPEEKLRAAGGTALRITKAQPCGDAFGRLRLLSLDELLSRPPPAFMVAGLITPATLSVVWGAPKSGKTFAALRLAFCLALGRDVFGRAVKRPHRVLYVAAEGEGGLIGRLLALRRELGDPGDTFKAIAQRVAIGGDAAEIDDVIGAANAHGAELVVIDTLARCFGNGDENSNSDMGAFIANLDRLREETARESCAGAHVMVIHHGSKDEAARTPRGASALLGAADLVLRVEKGKDGAASTLTVDHAKDGEEGDVIAFRLEPVDLGTRPDGSPWTTCVAVEAEAPDHDARSRSITRLTAGQEAWWHAIADAFAEGKGTIRAPKPGMNETLTLTRDELRAALRVRGMFEAEPHASLTNLDRRRFADMLTTLNGRGKIAMRENIIWLA